MPWCNFPGPFARWQYRFHKIANDIRLTSCGPRAGFAELQIPENEPGSSIMPGKVNPTQAEALTMIAVQVMANDVAVGFGGAGGYLEMNVYKPLMIFNITHSITLMDRRLLKTNFRKFLVEGTKPNLKKINEYVERSLMLVTALSPVIGYDKASKFAHCAMDNDLTLKQAALENWASSPRRNSTRVVDPRKDGQALRGDCRCLKVKSRRIATLEDPHKQSRRRTNENDYPQAWNRTASGPVAQQIDRLHRG